MKRDAIAPDAQQRAGNGETALSTIITSWGPQGWVQYGRRFIETFAAYWPASVDLVCYIEEPCSLKRGDVRDLMQAPGCKAFLRRHRENHAARGMVPHKSWKRDDFGKGHSFRTDAYKFCRKPFAVRDAAQRLGAGVMCWMDADVVTTRHVPESWLDELLPPDADCAYLGRPGRHSECGFLAFRLPAARPLIERWAGYYESDAVFALDEWHDSYVFDRAREQTPGVRCHNITQNGRAHVWHMSPLTRWTDHLKGVERKELGYSRERMSYPEARAYASR